MRPSPRIVVDDTFDPPAAPDLVPVPREQIEALARALAPIASVVLPPAPVAAPRLSDHVEDAGYPGASLSTARCAAIARQCVANALGVNPVLLAGKQRGARRLAQARQLAIHLVHVVAGRAHQDTAVRFRRNRTTAAHHFERIEDLRDDEGFEAFMALLELQYAAMLRLAAVGDPRLAWAQALVSLDRAVEEATLEGEAYDAAEYVVQTFREKA
jgi:hypothetical protein